MVSQTVQTATEILRYHYGHDNLYDYQANAIDAAFKGDVFAVLATSAGKSVIFQIPALMISETSLIISPLIALMKDQVDDCNRRGISASYINSIISESEQKKRLYEFSEGKYKLFYVAPERLRNRKFREAVAHVPIGFIGIDEAHSISVDGAGFRVSYARIHNFVDYVESCQNGRRPHIIAVTATASPEMEEEIIKGGGLRQGYKRIIGDPVRENIKYDVVNIPSDEGAMSVLVGLIHDFTRNGRHIIYASTTKEVADIAKITRDILGEDSADYYHGQRRAVDRKMVQNKFKDGGLTVVAATKAFGMGIDIPDIRNVVHFGIPDSLEAYAQECVHPDSSIFSGGKHVLASDIFIGDYIRAYDNSGNIVDGHVSRVFNGYTSKWVRIRTGCGSDIKVTPNHPVLIKDGKNRKKFVSASDIKIGDYVKTSRLWPSENSDIWFLDMVDKESTYIKVNPSFFDRAKGILKLKKISSLFRLKRLYDYNEYRSKKAALLGRWIDVTIAAGLSKYDLYRNVTSVSVRAGSKFLPPPILNSDIGWLVGIIATDGYIKVGGGYGKKTGVYTVRIFNTNEKIIDKFVRIISSMGLHVSKKLLDRSRTPFNTKPCFIASVSSKVLVNFLNNMGVPSMRKSATVDCPLFLCNSSIDFRCGFLAGVFDGDGSYGYTSKHYPHIRLHSASWEFMSGVGRVLRSIGIIMKISIDLYKGKLGTKLHHGYNGRMIKYTHLKWFKEMVSQYAVKDMVNLRPINKGCSDFILDRRMMPKDMFWDKVIMVDSVLTGRLPVINFTVDGCGTYLVDGVVTHNSGRGGRDGKPSKAILINHPKAISTKKFFIDVANPPYESFRAIWNWILKTYPDGEVIRETADDLAIDYKRITGNYIAGAKMNTILNQLDKVGIVERIEPVAGALMISVDPSKAHKYNPKSKGAKRLWPEIIRRMEHALYDTEDEYGTHVGIDINTRVLADQFEVTEATIRSWLKILVADDAITKDVTFRGKTTKIIDPKANLLLRLPLERIRAKRKREEKKLKQMLDYTQAEDYKGFIRDYFLKEV